MCAVISDRFKRKEANNGLWNQVLRSDEEVKLLRAEEVVPPEEAGLPPPKIKRGPALRAGPPPSFAGNDVRAKLYFLRLSARKRRAAAAGRRIKSQPGPRRDSAFRAAFTNSSLSFSASVASTILPPAAWAIS